MKDFRPLNEEEQDMIRQIAEVLGRSAGIPCTACRYCTKGCPQEIAIPDIFAAMNRHLNNGRLEEAKEAYRAIENNASRCIACGQCEAVCPQHIEIIEKLKECAETLQ